jgi:hypothetical protein
MRSRRLSGHLHLPDQWGNGPEVDVDGLLRIPTRSLRTGVPPQDVELRRQIRAREHPEIMARLLWLGRPDGATFPVAGSVSFLGTTRHLEGEVEIREQERDLRIRGDATVDFRDFGLEPNRILGLEVHPTVQVRIDLRAQRR